MLVLATVAYPVPTAVNTSGNTIGTAPAAPAPGRQRRGRLAKLRVLLLAIIAGICQSAALATRAAARLVENAAAKIVSNRSGSASGASARMETTQRPSGTAQTADSAATGRTSSKEGAPSPTTALVRTGRPRYQQKQGRGKTQITSLSNSSIPLICFYYTLALICFSILTFTSAATASNNEQVLVFDEIGKMASSMAYIHVAIPLNLSTFEHQLQIFDSYLTELASVTTANRTEVTFTKAIRDLATFAKTRLEYLRTSVRFIDTILPEDTSQSKIRNKRSLPITALTIYLAMKDLLHKYEQSKEGDLFFPNGTLKNNSFNPIPNTPPTFDVNNTAHAALNRTKRWNPDPLAIPIFYGQWLLKIKAMEKERRAMQMLNYTNNLFKQLQATTTTPLYPDYPEFEEVLQSASTPSPLSSSTTSPFEPNPIITTAPPPFQFSSTEPSIANHDYDKLVRTKRQILAGIGAAAGVLGTFLGLFNEGEISNIRSQLGNVQANQNVLVHISHTHDQQIHLLHAELTHLTSIIKLLIKYNPALVYAKLESQLQIVQDRLKILQDAVQQLQHQRMAVTLLDLNQLHNVFHSVQTMASQKGYTLLPTKPQDFFQLDTSYIRTGANVLILLHVPCLTDNHLLTIYKFANLPYPVTEFTPVNDTAFPDHLRPIHTVHDILNSINLPSAFTQTLNAIYFVPDSDLIAIGRNDGVSDRYKLLSNADLAACIQRNHVYLCEHHQVLRTDLEGSCLGSLYLQSERGVRENCRLDRRPLRETVYQLSATDHLVVSPTPHTAQILCRNGSHFPIRLRLTSRISVPPACSLRLFNHTITSDDSVRIKPEPLQFTWTFNPLLLPSEIMQGAAHADDELNEIKDEIETVKNVTLQQGDFPDAVTNTLSQISHFSVLFWLSFSLGVLAIGLLTCWYCGSRKRRQSTRQRPDVMELPRTISEIADLNLDDDGRRRKVPTASAPPYSA